MFISSYHNCQQKISTIKYYCKASVSCLNDIERIFKQVRFFELCNVMKRLGHFNSNVPTVMCVFWQNNMASAVENASQKLLEMPFLWLYKFQNIPKRLSPQELVPLVQVPKPPTVYYQPATSKFLTALLWITFFELFYQAWLGVRLKFLIRRHDTWQVKIISSTSLDRTI